MSSSNIRYYMYVRLYWCTTLCLFFIIIFNAVWFYVGVKAGLGLGLGFKLSYPEGLGLAIRLDTILE